MSPTYKPPPPEVVRKLEESKRYIETSLKEGAEAGFALEHHEGLDLAGAVLSGAMLHEANFSRCRLDGAWLNNAWCGGLRLVGASLARTKFVQAELEGADFSGASGAWANFTKSHLTKARFDGSNFHGARFFKAYCTGSSFRDARLDEADLTRVSFEDSDLTGASLAAANLTDAWVGGANFTGAHFTRATRLQGCHDLESAIADRIFFDGLPVEGGAARKVLKSLTSAGVYDLLEPRERQLRLMLDCLNGARRNEVALKTASDSLLSLCSELQDADPRWRKDVASHAATLGSASLAAQNASLYELDEARARIAWATLDTLEALIRAPR